MMLYVMAQRTHSRASGGACRGMTTSSCVARRDRDLGPPCLALFGSHRLDERDYVVQIGVTLGFGNRRDGTTDALMFRVEAQSALRVEESGFDAVSAVEHHFDSYSMCSYNTVPHVRRRPH